MQHLSEMRPFRTLYTQTCLLSLLKPKPKPTPNPRLPFPTSPKSPHFSSRIPSLPHSPIRGNNALLNRSLMSSFSSWTDETTSSSTPGEETPENPKVFTTYDPVLETIVTCPAEFGEGQLGPIRKQPPEEESDTGGGSPTNWANFYRKQEQSMDGYDAQDEKPSLESVKEWPDLNRKLEQLTEESDSTDEKPSLGSVREWPDLNRKQERLIEESDCDDENPSLRSAKERLSLDRKQEKLKHVPRKFEVSSIKDSVLKRLKGKSKKSFVCSNCGESYGQWWGSCRACGEGTLKEFLEDVNVESKQSGLNVSERVVGSWLQQKQKPGEVLPQRLTDVTKGINTSTWRIPLSGLFGAEVARVLGGGIVPGSLVLVGGDPGVGKSTFLLQIASMIAEGCRQPSPVLYVSGEESVEQIGNRADRLRIVTEELFLYSSTDIEEILEKIQILSPRALIVDSIQTVYLKGVTGSAGSVSQVKECTTALLQFAKKTNIPVLLIGHVTKSGDIAGPRVLEHIVDVVLYMEGEKYSAHRFLRSVKNRFGSTDELGVFEMSEGGLQAVSNPSEIFLSEQHFDSEILAGLAVAVIIDGSRTFLIEIQALCLSDSSVGRHFTGVRQSRTEMIISVLMKQAGLKLQNNAIFVNVVSGVKLDDTAGDVAIAVAICSSFLEFPIPNHFAFIGEIGLGGELRPVPRMEKRVNALAKLGYKKCVVPKSAEKPLAAFKVGEMVIVGCKNLKEVINTVFRMQQDTKAVSESNFV